MKIVVILFRVLAIAAIGGLAFLVFTKTGELEEMTASRDAATNQYRKESKDHEETQEKLDLTAKQLDSSEADKRELQSDISKRKAQLVEKDRSISDLKSDVENREKKIKMAEKERDDLKKALIVEKQKVPPFTKEEYEEKVDQVASLEGEVESLKGDIAKLKQQVKEAPKQVASSDGGADGAPTTVLAVEPRAGLMLIGAGSQNGIAKDATFLVRQYGRRVAKVTIAEARPTSSVASIHPDYGVPGIIQPNAPITLSKE